MLPIAQGSALGKRRPRLIHSAFLRLRKNATRRKRVTHYALSATRGVAPHKAGCSYRARHFNQCNIVPPGRCPGLSATIGLTARHTCEANAVKSCIYMNVLLLKNWLVYLFTRLLQRTCRGRLKENLLPICRPCPPRRRDTAEMPLGTIPNLCSCLACRSLLLWPTPYGDVLR